MFRTVVDLSGRMLPRHDLEEEASKKRNADEDLHDNELAGTSSPFYV